MIHRIHFWGGRFDSQAQSDGFFHEHYDHADDDEPLSAFAASWHELFLDHDFMEMGFEQHH